MGKHKADQFSQTFTGKHAHAGTAPQVPKIGSGQKNQYRMNRSRKT